MRYNYDVIVVGAGHAGCEAASASARMGAATLLITMDMNKIGQMSCNPAVGGIAKGQIVREIDALGGCMGIVTDRSAIQFRMLNRSKGPAMWSPRAQCDRGKFIWNWRYVLENTPNLYIWQDQAMELLTDNGAVCGIKTLMQCEFRAANVVVCAGTFLNGLMHIGSVKIPGGRIAEPSSTMFGDSITACGVHTSRMKTGTPVRIDGRSVHFEDMERQDGENDWHGFSFLDSEGEENQRLKQLPCWTVYTNEDCHQRLREGLPFSPLYNGQIQSIGPRYCPSIETKLVTFPDREQHQLFLEPEGTETQEYYLNGFSSSLPLDVQIEALQRIPAFRDVRIYRPGYAIEYDFFDPIQLEHSLESKVCHGLFLAGQVNGTTGYEEAAGQGIVAGINAALRAGSIGSEKAYNPFVLLRDESYIGVLIDDLCNCGVDEPYRMFTSRAEYRILLRQDNADERLTERSYNIGLAERDRYEKLLAKRESIAALEKYFAEKSVKADKINNALAEQNSTPLERGCRLLDLEMRPELNIKILREIFPDLGRFIAQNQISDEVIEATEVKMKYSGYIRREREHAEKMTRLENIRIRGHFNYDQLKSLSTEARQKLSRINPETLAQASRIPGVSPSDINVLLVLSGR